MTHFIFVTRGDSKLWRVKRVTTRKLNIAFLSDTLKACADLVWGVGEWYPRSDSSLIGVCCVNRNSGDVIVVRPFRDSEL